MKRRWLRLEPGRRENGLAAGIALGAAAGVAAVVFYFGRILVSREEMPPLREGDDSSVDVDAASERRGPTRGEPR
jgi:hypothetical protein